MIQFYPGLFGLLTVLKTAKSKIIVLVYLAFGSIQEGDKGAPWKLFNKGTNPIHEGPTPEA